jgi:hypothetical protein
MSKKMEELYVAQINAKMAQVNLQLANIENPRSLGQIAKNCDGIFLTLNQIKEIQKICPSIKMDPTPDNIILQIEKTRDIKVTNFAITVANLNIEKVKAISNEKKRAKLLDEAKMLIIDAKNLVRGQEFLDKLEAKMAELKSL